MEKMLQVKDVQEHLGVCFDTAYKLFKVKGFPKIMIGKRYFVFEDDYIKWLKEHKKSNGIFV